MDVVKWEPISDLPEDGERLKLDELRPLAELWEEKRADLEQLDGMKSFRERLIRSWAIETGVIERVYDLDRGTTELLIERGLDSSLIDRQATDKEPELVAQILRDQRDAIEGVFDFVKGDRELSTSYVKELHATLTRSQAKVEAIDDLGRPVLVDLLRGEWKKLPNNPRRDDGKIHEYCPPEQVASEMDRLIDMHLEHRSEGISPEVEAAWLHHRFTQIHPFQDGNGRVARALASLIFLRAGWFPLTVHRDRKADYIECLEAADFGDLRHLSQMFGLLERDELVRALGIGDQAVRELEGIEQVIKAARDDLLGGSPQASRELEHVRATADRLQIVGVDELEAVRQLLNRQISEYRPEFSVHVGHAPADDERAHWYRREIFAIANDFHYFANLKTYGAWMRLRIIDRDSSTWDDLVFVFHGIGREFRGLIAVSAFHVQYQITAKGGRPQDREETARESITRELFQINPVEEPDRAVARFREWLREVVTIGLGQWRSGLSR